MNLEEHTAGSSTFGIKYPSLGRDSCDGAISSLIAAMQDVLPMRTKDEPSAVEMEPSVRVASRKAERERPSSRIEESRKRERYEIGWRRLNVVATKSALFAAADAEVEGPAGVETDMVTNRGELGCQERDGVKREVTRRICEPKIVGEKSGPRKTALEESGVGYAERVLVEHRRFD